jgi:LacI family transcriptional regulator
MNKVSLEDVAKALGVSKTLVSLVLNNKAKQHGISADTCKRVLEKVAEMNYRPNMAAKGLRTGKSNVVGLIVADISNSFYSKIARAIEDEARLNGYQLLICSSDEDEEKELQLFSLLYSGQQVEGIITSTTLTESDMLSNLAKGGYPMVLIDREIPKLNIATVVADNEKGAFKATELFIKNGMKRIGMLTISPTHLSSIKEREQGYKKALEKNGIKIDHHLIREIPFGEIKNRVKKELESLLKAPHRIDALFTANNHLTIAVIEAMNELNLRIPHDLAVISFDDIELFKLTNPGITAVAQPVEEIGKKAFQLLLDQMNGKEKPAKNKVVLPVDLVIRRSCGSVKN